MGAEQGTKRPISEDELIHAVRQAPMGQDELEPGSARLALFEFDRINASHGRAQAYHSETEGYWVVNEQEQASD